MTFLSGAICATCGSGVCDVDGRVACDSCELPTDCCLCPIRPVLRRSPAPTPALGPGSTVPRLAEIILRSGCRPAPFARDDTAMPASTLVGCPVILADSAAVYARAARDVGHTFEPADLPNVLPPYERCFVEMRRAKGGVPAWGAYLVRLDLHDRRVMSRAQHDASLGDAVRAEAAGARWLLLAGLVAVTADGQATGPIARYRLGLDDAGSPLADERHPDRLALSVSLPRLAVGGDDPGGRSFEDACTSVYFVPVLLALAFLHCEGVVLEPLEPLQPPEPGDATGSARLERLRIRPFETLLAQHDVPGSTMVDVAKDLVPGSFEDFRRGGRQGRSGVIRWRPGRPARRREGMRQLTAG